MSLDPAAIKKIAGICRISLSPEEEAYYAQELHKALEWMRALEKIKTDGLTPMVSTVESMPLRLRDDHVTEGNELEKLMVNAPESVDGSYAVPKMME